MNRFALLTALAVVAAAGCSTVGELPEFEARPGGEVLPFLTAFELSRPDEFPEKTGDDRFSLLDRTAVFQDDFFGPMTRDAAKLFQTVSVVNAGAAEEGEADTLGTAKRLKADLLVSVKPARHEIVYDGRNGYTIPNLIVWFLCWFPAWFVPDETWAADVEFEVCVRETKGGEELFKKTFKIRQERCLNDVDRGWNLFGTIFGPPGEPANFKQAARFIHPFAAVELRKKVFHALDTELRQTIAEKGITPGALEPEVPAVKPRELPDRVALVFGQKSSYAKYADRDAASIAGYLIETGFPSEGIRVFKGADASAANLKKELEELAKHPKARETKVVVFWSGSGLTVEEQGKGSPAVGSASDHLTLPALVEALGYFKDAALLVDAGFAGPGTGRSSATAPPPGETSVAWSKLLEAAPIAILLSAAAGAEALETDDLEGGVFTSSILDGLRGDADMDGDQKVLLGELKKFIEAQVSGYAKVMEKQQTPVLKGGKDQEQLFWR
jgi:hypothetical protein